MILSATLFLLAVICYSIKELKSFGKLKWMDDNKPYGFWGEKSDLRKYRLKVDMDQREKSVVDRRMIPMIPLDNWYYRYFKIKYEEAFLGSATAFIFVTDSSHMLQFFFKLLFCAAFYPLTNWWFPILLWCLWTIVWNLCDKYLTK